MEYLNGIRTASAATGVFMRQMIDIKTQMMMCVPRGSMNKVTICAQMILDIAVSRWNIQAAPARNTECMHIQDPQFLPSQFPSVFCHPRTE